MYFFQANLEAQEKENKKKDPGEESISSKTGTTEKEKVTT